MCCDLDGELFGGYQPLMLAGRGWSGGGKISEGPVGAPQVARRRVEDRVVLRESRSPVARIRELPLIVLGRLKKGTWENG